MDSNTNYPVIMFSILYYTNNSLKYISIFNKIKLLIPFIMQSHCKTYFNQLLISNRAFSLFELSFNGQIHFLGEYNIFVIVIIGI